MEFLSPGNDCRFPFEMFTNQGILSSIAGVWVKRICIALDDRGDPLCI